MEIYRDGKKITLTEQEVFLAYEEQENLYDRENVRVLDGELREA